MTIWFQIVLIIVSLATVTSFLEGLENLKYKLMIHLFWIFFSVVLLIFSVFPKLAEIYCECV